MWLATHLCMFVIHYAEIGIKGGNREHFERRLVSNIKAHLKVAGLDAKTRRRQGSVTVELGTADAEAVRTILSHVGGIEYFSQVVPVEMTMEAISAAAVKALAGESGTFRVTAKRAEKRFPMTSQEVAAKAGEAILDANKNLRVDLKHPDHTVRVEISPDGTYVSKKKEKGIGGLPYGTSGKLVSLLSGGIDSPVASWMIARRGSPLHYVSFHNFPYTDRSSIDIVKDLVAVLNRNARHSYLSLINLTPVQQEIVAQCDPKFRVLLYRRMMFRIAERIAIREHAKGFVTGESLGQVASQTVENMAAVGVVTQMPILRPCIGMDKNEIIDLAKKIGTFELSIKPHSDCCSLFVPENPATKSTARMLEAEEAKLDVKKLVEEALAKEERVEISEIR